MPVTNLKISEFYHMAQPLNTQVFALLASETARLFYSCFPQEPHIVHPFSLTGILLELNCSDRLLGYFVCGVDVPFGVSLL